MSLLPQTPESGPRARRDWPWVAVALIAIGVVFLVVHRWSIGAVLIAVGIALAGRWRSRRLERRRTMPPPSDRLSGDHRPPR